MLFHGKSCVCMAWKLTELTALSIIVSNDVYITKINEIRAVYDKAYPRWMPHINLVYQFAFPDVFPEVSGVLNEKLNNFGAFSIHLDSIGYFKQNKTVSVHLTTSDTSKIDLLYRTIISNLPSLPVQRKLFKPHLTIAQVDIELVDEKLEEFRKWLGLGFVLEVKSIYMLQRSQTNSLLPFHVAREISLC